MSIVVTIAGTDFNLPTQSENAPWGEDLSDLIQALVNVANNTVGSSDILNTSFSITNNQSVAANVIGAAFDTSQVRSAVIAYSIYISTSTNELSETGNILLTYKSSANSWVISQGYDGSSGVNFSITSAGQLQYTSSNVSGTSYQGKMQFNAKAFLQT